MSYTVDITVVEPTVIVDETNQTVTVNTTASGVQLNTNASIWYNVPVPGATGATGPVVYYNFASVNDPAIPAQSTSTVSFFAGGTGLLGFSQGDYIIAYPRNSITNITDTSTWYIGKVTSVGGNITINVVEFHAGATDSSAEWIINLTGQPGLYAAMGATGAQGPAGTNGTNGATGATGQTGATGPAGSGANSDQNLYTTSSVAFASVNLGGVVNTGVSYSGISGPAPITLDTFSSTSVRSAEYFVQVSDGSDYHVEKITLLATGADVYLDEYGIVYTNSLGSFTATQDVANVSLVFTPNSAVNMSIRVAITQLAI
jgi:hypothetical protein